MQLSKRLYAVASLAKDGKHLADVGTDHGYVPICLIQNGYIQSAIAMDINKGPLARAQENIRLYGLEEKIETRLSDGLEKLKPGEADTIVIAGMGGGLTVKILEEGKEAAAAAKTLVLQPQSELSQVRRYLQENGYRITEEDMVLDDGKYYPMMQVKRGEQSPWKDYEYRYGKLLIERKHPVLAEFLEKEYRTYHAIYGQLKDKEGAHIQNRISEVEEQLAMIEKAKEAMK